MTLATTKGPGVSQPVPTHTPLPRARMLIVAVGDFGLNIYWRSISYFLLFFYTDVVGLSVASASVIYMIASIVDGCIDPIIGMVIDRTRTPWGRYRPWIAIGSVPLALSFCLLYWVPSASGTALVVLVTAAHVLFRAFYTSVAVPVASLTARVTTDSRERTTLTGYRLLCGTTAGLVVAFCTQPVSAWLGRTQGEGFLWVAVLSGILATAVFMLVAVKTVEPPVEHEVRPLGAINVFGQLSSVFSNSAFWAMIVALLGATIALTVSSKALVYYFKYVVADEVAGRNALTITTFSAFVFIPLWTKLARRLGTRQVWLIGVLLAFLTLPLFLVLQPTTAMGATALFVTMQFPVAALPVAYWAMLPDTVEYGEWRTGIRLESTLVGLFMFFQKIGLGFAAALFGWALSWGGLDHALDRGGAQATLPMVTVALTLAGIGISGLAISFSPLRRGVHDRICVELDERRAAAAG